MRFLLRGGRLLDPASGRDELASILIEGEKVAAVGPSADAAAREHGQEGLVAVDLDGCWVTPGLVDLHAHLRDPGFPEKETIDTGTRAAAAGGFAAVACMPNTRPVLDSPVTLAYVAQRAAAAGRCQVYPVAAVTVGQAGEELVDFEGLAEAGAVAFSDDGLPVGKADLMRAALTYSRALGIPIVSHAEELTLSRGGAAHQGRVANRLGLPGIPASAESVMVARDILLAGETGGQLHIAHVSARESVDLLRWAKGRGVRVSAEVTPHHLALTDEAVGEFDTNRKMNPPLREPEDREALREALRDGTIDCIATDHAPHTADEKAQPFAEAPFGVIGLETAFPVVYEELVAPGFLPPLTAVARLTVDPARIFGLPVPRLAPGEPANVAVFDVRTRRVVGEGTLYSRSRNSAFLGRALRGWAVLVFFRGKVVHDLLNLGVTGD